MNPRWKSAGLDRQRGNFYSRTALLSIGNSPGGDGMEELIAGGPSATILTAAGEFFEGPFGGARTMLFAYSRPCEVVKIGPRSKSKNRSASREFSNGDA
jgi:hypothetical protein